jgi:hypothetical protein
MGLLDEGADHFVPRGACLVYALGRLNRAVNGMAAFRPLTGSLTLRPLSHLPVRMFDLRSCLRRGALHF